MEVGNRVKVVANTYMGGAQSNHRGKKGTITAVDLENDKGYGKGYFVRLEGDHLRLFFEEHELEKV